MKKNFKLILALVLSLMMVLASVSALAADDDTPAAGGDTPAATTTKGSIIIKPNTTSSTPVTVKDKTLKAYKILNVTYSGTGENQAVAYSIPNSMKTFFDNYAEFKGSAATASAAAAAAGKTLDTYVMDIMKDWGNDSAKIKDFAKAALDAAKTAGITAVTGTVSDDNIVFENRDPGYYVIEDTATQEPISAVILDTVTDANVEIIIKASDETKKEIMTAGDLLNSKANELGLGRAVNFKITQKIPDPTGYDYYYYLINDKLSTGLTFNPTTVVVKVGTKTLTEGTDYHLYYVGDTHNTTTTTLGGKTFIVAFDDIVRDTTATPAVEASEGVEAQDAVPAKFNVGDAVEVTYTATVNSEAVTGIDPNNNDVTVQYSNNPNKDGKGDYDTDHPGIPANDGNHPTGEGPHKYTVTYTTKVTILKKDGKTKAALPGVEFTLTGKAKDAVFNAEEVYEIDPAGTYWLLTNGKYTETAPQTAPTVEETTGSAGWVLDDTYTKADGRKVGDHVYRPYVEATDSSKTRYVIIEPNNADYTSTTTKYSIKTETADAAEEYDVARNGITANDGKLSFAQLGAGTYTLSETGILAGYNGIEDITFTVTCTTPTAAQIVAGNETAEWNITTEAPGVTFTPGTDEDAGTFTITIENNKGVELPSTGGIGTTIFYVAGSILVLAAAVLLITKRRMGAND